MKFRATLELHGKTATGITVPDEVVEALAGGKRPPVSVTINTHTYRTTIAPMGGAYLIPVSAEHRTAAGVRAGEELDVLVELDSQPREVVLPPDLEQALTPAARAFFDGLSFTNKSTYVTWIEDAKKPETRQQRLAKTVEALEAGQVRR